MAVTVTFLAIFLAHFAATVVQIRFGLLMLIFLYGVYPKFLSLGVSDQGFALSGQRAMLYGLLGVYTLRALAGSTDVQRGFALLFRYRGIVYGVMVYLGARLVGNALSGRMDLGSFAAFVNESAISILVIVLIVTYVKTRQDVITVLALVTASLLLNQVVAIVEFLTGESLFVDAVDIQYASDESSTLLEGSVRGGFFRSRGFFDNPLKLAGFVCLCLPGAIALARTSKIVLVRVFAVTAIVLAPVAALFTGSRTGVAVVSLMFMWYAYAYIVRGFGPWQRRFLNVVALLAAIGVITLIATGVAESWIFGSGYGRSAESRLLQFVRVPAVLVESPLFGFGYARHLVGILDVGHVDSLFLTTALEGGIVAAGAILLVMYRAIRLLTSAATTATDKWLVVVSRHLAVSIGFAFLLGLVLSLNHIRFYLFCFIGLAIVLHNLSTGRQPAEQEQGSPTKIPV